MRRLVPLHSGFGRLKTKQSSAALVSLVPSQPVKTSVQTHQVEGLPELVEAVGERVSDRAQTQGGDTRLAAQPNALADRIGRADEAALEDEIVGNGRRRL